MSLIRSILATLVCVRLLASYVSDAGATRLGEATGHPSGSASRQPETPGHLATTHRLRLMRDSAGGRPLRDDRPQPKASTPPTSASTPPGQERYPPHLRLSRSLPHHQQRLRRRYAIGYAEPLNPPSTLHPLLRIRHLREGRERRGNWGHGSRNEHPLALK